MSGCLFISSLSKVLECSPRNSRQKGRIRQSWPGVSFWLSAEFDAKRLVNIWPQPVFASPNRNEKKSLYASVRLAQEPIHAMQPSGNFLRYNFRQRLGGFARLASR
jgi:hypothetical protein